jgi:hypothetical protein
MQSLLVLLGQPVLSGTPLIGTATIQQQAALYGVNILAGVPVVEAAGSIWTPAAATPEVWTPADATSEVWTPADATSEVWTPAA